MTTSSPDTGHVLAPPPAPKQPRRYRGRTPDERREQRRRRLLDAALELFATAGYQNTSVERICSTSGVTGRHFYEEFASRELLLSAVYDDIMGGALQAVAADVAAAPRQLRLRLDAGVGAYMHYLLDDPRRALVVGVEVVGVSRDLEAHRRDAGMAFAQFIGAEAVALREAGQELVGNDLTVLALVAAVHELTVAWLDAEEPIDIDALVSEAVRIVMAVALAPKLTV